MANRLSGQQQIRAIRKAFWVIEEALVVVAEQTSGRPQSGSQPSTDRRRLNLSPKRRAELKLQGAYMGYMRQLRPRQKARIKSLKEKNGYTAAIRLAKQLAAR